MTPVMVSEAVLAKLPEAIWIPYGSNPVIYRGNPLDIVQMMAQEMGNVPIRTAICQLIEALARHRQVLIQLPECNSDEQLAQLFVFALLHTALARPLPEA